MSTPAVSLADQLAARRAKLASTTTRVRHRDGTMFEERRNVDGTIVASNYTKEALPAFMSDNAAGFSRLQGRCWDAKAGNYFLSSTTHHDIHFDGSLLVGFLGGEGNGKWIAATDSFFTTSSTTRAPLRIVTYNVWFKDWYLLQRAHALFNVVNKCDADVICFQVTHSLLTYPFFV
jgi:hypothetical protein